MVSCGDTQFVSDSSSASLHKFLLTKTEPFI